MENNIYELNGYAVMDVEVDGVLQTRRVVMEMYGSRLTSIGVRPLNRPKPETTSNEILCEELGGRFRIITAQR